MILVPILYFFWTITIFLNKQSISYCTYPFFIGGLRSFFSGLLLILYEYFTQKNRMSLRELSGQEWKKLFTCSIMLYGIAISGFSLGLDYISPIVASFVLSSAPFITAGLLYCLRDEKLSKNKTIGLLIGFVGVSVIILGGHESDGGSNSLFGAAIYLSSMLLFCYSWIILKDLFSTHKNSSFFLNGIAMTFGGAISLFFSMLFTVSFQSVKLLFIEHGLLVFGFLGATAICYGLYSYLLTKFTPTFLSFAGFLDPMFAALFGFILGQPFQMIFLYAFIALFAGLYIFYKEELKKV